MNGIFYRSIDTYPISAVDSVVLCFSFRKQFHRLLCGPSNRAMNEKSTTSEKMTIKLCQDYCRNENFRYAGLQVSNFSLTDLYILKAFKIFQKFKANS